MVVCALMYVAIVGAFLSALWRPAAARAADGGRRQASKGTADRGPAARRLGDRHRGRAHYPDRFELFHRPIDAKAGEHPQLLVNVIGNQWWWDVQYSSGDASKSFRTANELHLPVASGRGQASVERCDPQLLGARSRRQAGSIPGRATDIQLVPRKTGLFRGQCAEFCGVQHAHMALDVTVESRENFRKWVAAQQRVAFAPQSPQELAGYRCFTTRNCGACHAITGSPASATVGPDLTHFASRRSIAAGTLPMSSANVEAWIADPQQQKPGNNMPKSGSRPSSCGRSPPSWNA